MSTAPNKMARAMRHQRMRRRLRLSPCRQEPRINTSAPRAATRCGRPICRDIFSAASWPLFRSWSENAYGIYFVHYVFVLWLQYLLLDVALPAVVKAAIVFTTGPLRSIVSVSTPAMRASADATA